MERIIAYCGIVCSECDVYLATVNNDENLKKELAKRYTTDEQIARPEDFYCEGCFNIKGEGCKIRQCAYGKGHQNCAACSSYFCALLDGHFADSPQSKVVLDEIRQNTIK